jgi:hypothetical protein
VIVMTHQLVRYTKMWVGWYYITTTTAVHHGATSAAKNTSGGLRV